MASDAPAHMQDARRSGPGAIGRHELPLVWLTAAWLGPPVVWSAHFGLVYLLDTLTCTVVLGSADVLIFVLTVVSAAASAGSGWLAWRGIRRLRAQPQPRAAAAVEPPGREGALLLMGLAGAVLFTLLILLEGMVPAFLPDCGQTTMQ